MSMAEQILDYVSKYRNVTFAELTRNIEGFGGGDIALAIDNSRASNFVLWVGLTEQAYEAVTRLQSEQKIHVDPTPLLTYIIDGCCLRLPVAKTIRHYKKPHWSPVVLNPGPRCK